MPLGLVEPEEVANRFTDGALPRRLGFERYGLAGPRLGDEHIGCRVGMGVERRGRAAPAVPAASSTTVHVRGARYFVESPMTRSHVTDGSEEVHEKITPTIELWSIART
ncbi:MAG: hypothetical protein OXQ84_13800 [bacterium]|nr:hypothetical protein [bacterium]